MAAAGSDARIIAVRHFNRFYTQKIGVLDETYLQSPFSLSQVRLLYELAHRSEATASELGRELGLDPGYLSRIIGEFTQRGLIARQQSREDSRRFPLRITAHGRRAFLPIEARSRRQIGRLLQNVSPAKQRAIVQAMQTIEAALDARVRSADSFVLRPHRPGDMGWVVHRHGALYAQEFGWDERFEALVAEIVAQFLRSYDPRRERCWIAERGGEIAGSVFLVKHTAAIAKLRLLLVEPEARGSGLGRRLVEECEQFARAAGYRGIRLWTNHVLHAARRLYRSRGYRLIERKTHRSFGPKLVGETWQLDF